MAIHSSIFAWQMYGQWSLTGYTPWGQKSVRHNLVTKQQQQKDKVLCFVNWSTIALQYCVSSAV